MKDQTESFFYFPSLHLQRVVGGFGGLDFGGFPTLRQRNESFDIRESMSVQCGYVS